MEQVKTFAKITDSSVPSNARLKHIHLAWTKKFLPYKMCTFLFKFYSNLLGTGNRVAHFVGDFDSSCTFCTAGLLLPSPIESFLHIFLHCPLVNPIVSAIISKYTTIENAELNYFCGTVSKNERWNTTFSVFFDTIKYVIWQVNLDKKVPSLNAVKTEVR